MNTLSTTLSAAPVSLTGTVPRMFEGLQRDSDLFDWLAGSLVGLMAAAFTAGLFATLLSL